MKRKAINNDDNDSDDQALERPSFSHPNSFPKKSRIGNNNGGGPSTHPKRIPDTGFIIFEQMSDAQGDAHTLNVSAAKQGVAMKYLIEKDDQQK